MASEDYGLGFHEARDTLIQRLGERAPGRLQLL
jgi:hypothetical protein